MKPYTPPKGDIRNIERGKAELEKMIKESEAADAKKAPAKGGE